MKIKILTGNRKLLHSFNLQKKQIINQFIDIDLSYVKKIIDLKNPAQSLKDLFQVYKIADDIYKFKDENSKLDNQLKDIRDQLIITSLKDSPSNINNKKYLDELLYKLN